MENENSQKSFWDEAFDRKTRIEMVRTAAWAAAFAITFYGIRKIFS